MSEKYSLNEQVVRLFLDAGWTFDGRVEYSDETKIVLKSDLGSLVVYKSSIVAAMILKDKDLKALKNEPHIEEDKPRPAGRTMIEEYQEKYFGSMIPSDMLIEDEEDKIPVDFSLSMANLRNPSSPGGGKDGSEEEDASYRKKD